MNAVQVFVRGFQSSQNGDRIIKILEGLGFDIKESFDGTADSRGGIISTHIAPVDELETDNLDEIREAVAVAEGTFIQYRTFRLGREGECQAATSADGGRLVL